MTIHASHTALTAAAARAAHLIVDDDPPVFADPLAMALLGEQAQEYVAYHRAHGGHVVLAGARGQVTYRSRYAEDSLARAAERGTSQYVILGAGLDSFGYRSPLAGQVRVFEVDHPATGEWKRAGLAAAGIEVPDSVRLVPADFETASPGSLVRALAGAGLDLAEPAFVSWLGVSMYLTAEAIGQTLAELGTLAPGSELVADYMLPASLRDASGSTYVELVAPAAAERGEPWRTFLAPGEMSALLAAHGFGPVRHVGMRDVGDETTWQRSDAITPIELSRLVHAVLGPR